MKAYAVDHNGNQHCSKRINIAALSSEPQAPYSAGIKAGGQNLFHIGIRAVQLCERALASLKYFCEDAPDYHIIAAGSLLGVAVNRSNFSFPVGKVDMKTLYPMDMEEFMLAMGEKNLVTQIKKCFETDTPMPSALHDAAMQLYRQYLIAGGMPECVVQFAETKDYILVRHTQDTKSGFACRASYHRFTRQSRLKKRWKTIGI